MNVFLRALAFSVMLPLSAQLMIPGLLEDQVPEAVSPSIFIPAPERIEGLHADTNATREIPLPVGALNPDARGMLRMMEGQHPIFMRQDLALRPHPADLRFQAGPSNVLVRLELTHGQDVRGTLRNQPILVDTHVGRMALPLHEVERIDRLPETAVFRIELQGGDVVTGEVATAHLHILQADGGNTRVPASRWRSLSPGK